MIDQEGVVTDSDWENVDFTIFEKLQYCTSIEELIDELLMACKAGGLHVSREFLPLRQTLGILYEAGLISYDIDDVENAFLNRAVTSLNSLGGCQKS